MFRSVFQTLASTIRRQLDSIAAQPPAALVAIRSDGRTQTVPDQRAAYSDRVVSLSHYRRTGQRL